MVRKLECAGFDEDGDMVFVKSGYVLDLLLHHWKSTKFTVALS